MATLTVNNLGKRCRSRDIVKDLNLHIKSGEIVGLLGANGAGKTTSFDMISGSIRNDFGTITLNEKSIDHLPIHKRARAGISYLPQEPSVFRKLTVAQNILAILELGPLKRKQRYEKLEQLLKEFNLQPLRKSLGSQLSGGERRRVEIARALSLDPVFILLDEPFAGIDPLLISDIKQLICYLAERGIGVLITDHNVRETLAICHRAYILHQGCVIAEGDINAILASEEARKAYLGDMFKEGAIGAC